MNDPFRYALMVEMRDLLTQHEIFKQGRTARPALQRILVVAYNNSLIGGELAAGTFGGLMNFTARAGDVARRCFLRGGHGRLLLGTGERTAAAEVPDGAGDAH